MNNVRACAMLLAFPDAASKRTAQVWHGLTAAAALLAAWFTYVPREAELLGATFWGLGVMIVWASAGPMGEGLRREAQATCLPCIGRTVLLAWAILAAITLLLPALVLGLRGGDFAELAGLLLAIALWGCLIGSFARQDVPVPVRSMVAGFMYLPIVSVVHLYYPTDPGRAAAFAWMSAALLGSVLALGWRWQRRKDAPGQASSTQDPAERNARSGWLAGFRYRTTVAHLHSSDPKTAMRALLGPPFAPLSWQQRYVLWPLAIAAFPVVAAWANWFFGTGTSTIVSAPLEMGLWCIWMLYFLRLRNLFGPRRNGAAFVPIPMQMEELTELALLPAWHDAPSARGLLLKSVLQPQLFMLLLLALATVLFAGSLGGRAIALPFLLCAFAGIAMGLIASTLRVLARMPLVFSTLASFAPCLLALFMTMAAMEIAFEVPSHVSAVDAWIERVTIMLWLVSLVTTGLLARDAWRRFTEQPHPFLAT